MKLKHLTSGLLAMILFMPALLAGNCGYYLPLVEGRGIQLQHFNQRDRLQSTQEVTVQKVDRQGDRLVATMHTRMLDQRDREMHQATFTVICDGNQLLLDVQSLLDPGVMEGFKGMEVRIDSDHMVMPNSLSAGQDLPDAALSMKVLAGGVEFADVSLSISGRTVEGREQISVPAGTFESYRVSYHTHMETRAMGIPVRMSGKTIEFHAPGVGAVRTETYDERERLQGYTVLSKII
jgi:hypothetical protein